MSNARARSRVARPSGARAVACRGRPGTGSRRGRSGPPCPRPSPGRRAPGVRARCLSPPCLLVEASEVLSHLLPRGGSCSLTACRTETQTSVPNCLAPSSNRLAARDKTFPLNLGIRRFPNGVGKNGTGTNGAGTNGAGTNGAANSHT